MVHVLLVEDEALVAMLFSAALEDRGYRVSVASCPREALEIDADSPADILVTDYRMPGDTGADLLRALRARRPALPAIIVSGWLGDATDLVLDDITLAYHKPASPDAIANAIPPLIGRTA